jgi:hypothetical protein
MAGLLDLIAPEDEILPQLPAQRPLWMQDSRGNFPGLAWAPPWFPPDIQQSNNGQNQMMPPPYDPTQYPRDDWSATKAFGQGAANVLFGGPPQEIGAIRKRVIDGQGSFDNSPRFADVDDRSNNDQDELVSPQRTIAQRISDDFTDHEFPNLKSLLMGRGPRPIADIAPGYVGKVPGIEDTRAIKAAMELAPWFGPGLAGRLASVPIRAAAPLAEAAAPIARVGRNVANELASKSANLHTPPVKLLRAFEEDYKFGGIGNAGERLTVDMDGRRLTAPFVVGRRVVQGIDEPLSTAEVVAAAKNATGNSPQAVARSSKELGGDAGRYSVTRDRRSDRVLERNIFFDKNAGMPQKERIVAHELGHAIDEIAGRIPLRGLDTELRRNYNTLFAGQERTRHLTGPQHVGYSGENVGKELMAEAIRAYIANPNYFKTVASKTAARIREYVNSHPELSKIVQFNTVAGAGAVPLLNQPDSERMGIEGGT